MPKRKHEMKESKNAQNICNKLIKNEDSSSNSLDSEQENKAQNFQLSNNSTKHIDDGTVDFRAEVSENLKEIQAIEENFMMDLGANDKPEVDFGDFDGK